MEDDDRIFEWMGKYFHIVDAGKSTCNGCHFFKSGIGCPTGDESEEHLVCLDYHNIIFVECDTDSKE